MLAKIVGDVPVYNKAPLAGERTSEFVPSGAFVENGTVVEGKKTETDNTGTFLEIGGGNYINLSDTEEIEAAA